jgi:hypothetical protein
MQSFLAQRGSPELSEYGLSPTDGSATTLQMDNSPVKHFLLKFDVTGVNGQTVTNAKIRLYNVDATAQGRDFA